jgi:hypothetical protein
VSGFDLSGEGSDNSRGRDRWIGMDGTALVSVTVPSYGEVLLAAQTSDRIFKAGLE